MAFWREAGSARAGPDAQSSTAGDPFRRGRQQFWFVLRRDLALGLAGLGLVLLLSACRVDATTQAGLTVAAAANVGPAFQEIGERFQQETGIAIVFVLGSTGTLAQQLKNGAPYDVFAAADVDTVERLVAEGLLEEDTQRSYAQGRLALVVNRESSLSLSSLQDLADPAVTRVAVANPQHAPYGRAAEQALRRAGLWPQVAGKLVWAENVRQALQFVQTGDAQAGLVALSIADVPEVITVVVPSSWHDPIDQAIAVSARSVQPEVGRRFVAFLTGPVGQEILQRYRYQAPGGQ